MTSFQKHIFNMSKSIARIDLSILFTYEIVNLYERRFATSWDCAELRLVITMMLLRRIARGRIDCVFVELRGTLVVIAWECAEQRLPNTWDCAEMRPTSAWKCAEPRLPWKCKLRVCLQSAARVRGTRVRSAWEVRLECGSNAWNHGSTHWRVQYLCEIGTLRSNTIIRN